MARAIWNGAVLAESDEFQFVEGNIYFPPESINREYFRESNFGSLCPWKGQANYFSIEVEGKRNENAAWYYAHPKPAVKQISNYVAFWKGVKIER